MNSSESKATSLKAELITNPNASKTDDLPEPFEPINKTNFADSGILSIKRLENLLKFIRRILEIFISILMIAKLLILASFSSNGSDSKITFIWLFPKKASGLQTLIGNI